VERGSKVGLIASMDEETEAMNVLDTVKSLIGEGTRRKKLAVLYRTNAQSRALEDVLKLSSLPYQIIGGVRFLRTHGSPRHSRVLQAARKSVGRHQSQAHHQRSARGLGKATYETLAAAARSRDVTIMDILKSESYDVGSAQKKRCKGFVALFDKLRATAEKADAPKVVEAIVAETGYREYLRESYPDADARVENVDELVRGGRGVHRDEGGQVSRRVPRGIALVADIDTLDAATGQITLMTLHNAKGLEYDCVIIAGVEDGSCRTTTLSKRSRARGGTEAFLRGHDARAEAALPVVREHEETDGHDRGRIAVAFFLRGSGGVSRRIDRGSRAGRIRARGCSAAPLRAGETIGRRAGGEGSEAGVRGLLAGGSRLLGGNEDHPPDFGRGVVRKVEGSGENLRVTVLFDNGSERKFLAHYAPMRPLA